MNFNRLFNALEKGDLDAILLEGLVADSYLQHNNQLKIIKCQKLNNFMGTAIAVNKNYEGLLKEINKILEKLKKEIIR